MGQRPPPPRLPPTRLLLPRRCSVWIVDEAGKGIGVLTPTDALRLVVS